MRMRMLVQIVCPLIVHTTLATQRTCENLLVAANLDWRRSYGNLNPGTGYARNVQWNDIADPYVHKGTAGEIDVVSNVVSWQPGNHAKCDNRTGTCQATYWYNYDNYSAIPAPVSSRAEGVFVGVWAKTNQTTGIPVVCCHIFAVRSRCTPGGCVGRLEVADLETGRAHSTDRIRVFPFWPVHGL